LDKAKAMALEKKYSNPVSPQEFTDMIISDLGISSEYFKGAPTGNTNEQTSANGGSSSKLLVPSIGPGYMVYKYNGIWVTKKDLADMGISPEYIATLEKKYNDGTPVK